MNRARQITLLALAVVVVMFAVVDASIASSVSTADTPLAADASAWFKLRGKVTRVVDGDTMHVHVGRKIEKVRLIGVDAP